MVMQIFWLLELYNTQTLCGILGHIAGHGLQLEQVQLVQVVDACLGGFVVDFPGADFVVIRKKLRIIIANIAKCVDFLLNRDYNIFRFITDGVCVWKLAIKSCGYYLSRKILLPQP